MKKLAIVLTVGIFGLSSFAGSKTWYVDAANWGRTGLTGAQDAAYGTIQDAVDAAASGDTILVAPGRYDQGGRNFQHASNESYCGMTRVGIIGKRLTVKSTGDRNNTFIVGMHDPDTEDGIGPKAVRCVVVCDAGDSIIQGFTLLDGSTTDVDDNESCAGGFYSWDTNWEVYLVDSTVRNCTGKIWAGAYAGTFIRCLVENCRCRRLGAICRFTNLYFTILASNFSNDSDRNGYVCDCSRAVNCTFTGNFTTRAMGDSVSDYNKAFNCVIEGSGFAEDGNLNSCRYTTDDYGCYLIGPAYGDFRVRVGSGAEVAGTPQLISECPFTVPAEYVAKDFNRQTVDLTGETVVAGAVRDCATAVSGVMKIGAYGSGELVDLANKARRVFGRTYFYEGGTEGIRQFSAVPGPGSVLYRAMRDDYSFYPDRDDAFSFVAPIGADSAVQCYVQFVGNENVVWADPSADAAFADGSEEHPYRTLQAAVDAAPELGVIYAKAGVYAEGSGTKDSWEARARVNLSKHCRLVAVEGPDKTFIVGEPDPDMLTDESAPGCGPKAVSGVLCTTMGQVLGFTITGCYATSSETASYVGSGFRSPGFELEVAECVISNNFGTASSAGTGARVVRCCIAENTTYGLEVVLHNVIISSCLVRGNTSRFQLFSADCRVYDSTVIMPEGGRPFDDASRFVRVNSIFVGGTTAYAAAVDANCDGNLYWGFDEYGDQRGTVGDPELVAYGDCRVSACSPALTAGMKVWTSPAFSEWRKFATRDYLGAWRKLNRDGGMVAGAAQVPVKGIYLVAPDAGLSIAGVEPGFTAAEEMAGDLVISATDHSRPVCGVSVDGEPLMFEDLPSHAVRISAAQVLESPRGFTFSPSAGATKISAIYSNNWYVSPSGDDGALGFYPSCAKRTLAAALGNPSLESGDTVHAAAGEYAEGAMIQDEECVVFARAVVPGGVTLVADEGPAVTSIVGARAVTNVTDEVHGMGTDAIRCVYLNDAAKLRGFTICGGRSLTSDSPEHYHADYSAGGVCGRISGQRLALVENCTITNCVGYRGGALRYVTAFNCRIFENYGLYNSAISGESALFGCVADRNYGYAQNYDWRIIDSCTFGPNNCYGNYPGSSVMPCPDAPDSADSVCRNTLTLGPVDPPAGKGAYHNCYCTSLTSEYVGEGAFTVVAAEELALDAEYRPVVGSNAAIDKCNVSIIPSEINGFVPDLSHDAAGGQRIYNAAMDVGALEGDWRSTYARAIAASSRFVVESATENVTTNANGTVVLMPGEETKVLWTKLKESAPGYKVQIRVVGDGALTACVDGAVVDVQVGSGEKTIEIGGVDRSVALRFSGEGWAEILGADRSNPPGACVFIR